MKRPAVLLLLLLGVACARDPVMKAWTDRWLEAERHLSRDEHDQARSEFETLARTAASLHDAVEARARIAEIERRAGDTREALAILEGLLEKHGSRLDADHRAKLRWNVARAALDAGQAERGWALMERLIDLQPNTGWGTRAFLYVQGELLRRDEDAFTRWCRSKYEALRDTDLADNLLYEAGRVWFRRGTDVGDAQAEVLFRVVLKRWSMHSSGLWDDALWDLSLIYHRHGRYAEERDLLRRLLGKRSTTWLGSEQIENYRHAYIRLGKLLYEQDGDYLAAAKHFAGFETIWPHSILVDDMLWWQGHALLRGGQAAKSRAVFDRIQREWPESKYTRRIRDGHPGPGS